jgi:hypothetical protein
VRRDLAADEHAAQTLQGTADAYVETTLLRRSLFEHIARSGTAVTAKGRTRAALATYLQVLDRELKLARTLGLERRQRRRVNVAEELALLHEEARS